MSLYIFFAVLLGILAYQTISAQRSYARKQASLTAQEAKVSDSESQPNGNKPKGGQYTITPLESLAPQLQPKPINQSKPVKQS